MKFSKKIGHFGRLSAEGVEVEGEDR